MPRAVGLHDRCSLTGDSVFDEAGDPALGGGLPGEREIAGVGDHRAGFDHGGALDRDVEQFCVLQLEAIATGFRGVGLREFVKLHDNHRL